MAAGIAGRGGRQAHLEVAPDARFTASITSSTE